MRRILYFYFNVATVNKRPKLCLCTVKKLLTHPATVNKFDCILLSDILQYHCFLTYLVLLIHNSKDVGLYWRLLSDANFCMRFLCRAIDKGQSVVVLAAPVD